jgi:hypothetical protein
MYRTQEVAGPSELPARRAQNTHTVLRDNGSTTPNAGAPTSRRRATIGPARAPGSRDFAPLPGLLRSRPLVRIQLGALQAESQFLGSGSNPGGGAGRCLPWRRAGRSVEPARAGGGAAARTAHAVPLPVWPGVRQGSGRVRPPDAGVVRRVPGSRRLRLRHVDQTESTNTASRLRHRLGSIQLLVDREPRQSAEAPGVRASSPPAAAHAYSATPALRRHTAVSPV